MTYSTLNIRDDPDYRAETWGEAQERAGACARRAEQLLREGKIGVAHVMALLAIDARLECVEHAVGDLPK